MKPPMREKCPYFSAFGLNTNTGKYGSKNSENAVLDIRMQKKKMIKKGKHMKP